MPCHLLLLLLDRLVCVFGLEFQMTPWGLALLQIQYVVCQPDLHFDLSFLKASRALESFGEGTQNAYYGSSAASFSLLNASLLHRVCA